MISKRWVVRVALAVSISVAARTVWLVADREQARRTGEQEFAEAVLFADADDPQWRWDDLAKNRRIPPAGKNGAELISRVQAKLPYEWVRPVNPVAWEPTLPEQSIPEMLPSELLDQTRKMLDRAAEAVRVARRFKDYPDGNRVLDLAPDVLSTRLQDTNDTRSVATLLRWDAIAAIADGNRERAGDNLAALLNVSRSLGDEPFLISQLVRVACRSIAVWSSMWVLAQSELAEERLAVLQSEWALDSEEPLLLYGVRGERAAYDILFRNMADGTVTPDSIQGRPDDPKISFEGYAWWLYRGRLPRERAYHLHWMTEAVKAARLRNGKQAMAVAALPPPPGDDMRLAQLLHPAVAKVAGACQRSMAEARCLVVALACERHRLRHGAWPDRLDSIPRDLLMAVPEDPYDGNSLRYRVIEDGIVIYSVGVNGTDDGGSVAVPGRPEGADVGVRMWNVGLRGRAARRR